MVSGNGRLDNLTLKITKEYLCSANWNTGCTFDLRKKLNLNSTKIDEKGC